MIGMTCMPEAKLAREAEICYALVSLPTDYDCWRPPPSGGDHPGVLDEVIRNLKAASAKASKLIEEALPHLAGASADCRCRSALKQAIWSDPERIPSAVRVKLKPLISRYLADV